MSVRPAAIAGSFYPVDPQTLQRMIESLLQDSESVVESTIKPKDLKALILPHAGYIYSGLVAACGYRLLQNLNDRIRRIVLLGPNHRVPLSGMALPSQDYFSTPLGNIPIDTKSVSHLSAKPEFQIMDLAHDQEHCLEVQLPFLQTVLEDFTLLPIVVGNTKPEHVAKLIQSFWQDNESFVIISTDLSHFHSYSDAKRIDAHTSQLIETKSWQLHGEQACGAHPLNGLLKLANDNGLTVTTLKTLNSGDTAGDKDRVVGYGAYAVS